MMIRSFNASSTFGFMLLAFIVAVGCCLTTAHGDSMDELKQRFKERYPAVASLKTDGKVGEVHTGYLGLVEDGAGQNKVTVAGKEMSVAELIVAENADRTKLYEQLAKQLDTTVEKIAQRNAIRNFEKAGPNEYLKLKNRPWTRKKDIK